MADLPIDINRPESISAECETLVAHERQLFSADYQRHFIAGESKPKHIGEPYLLHNPNATHGILLIHGLMAAPEEVREWADFLFSKA